MNTLIDLIFAFRDRSGLALKYKNGYRTFSYSYPELYRLIGQTADYLKQIQGVNPDDRVALWGSNGPNWVISYFAIISLGAIAVPIDFKSSREHAEKIIVNSGSRLIIKSKFRPAAGPNAIYLEDIRFLSQNCRVLQPLNTHSENDLIELVYTSGTTGDPKGVMITHKNLVSNISAVTRHIHITGQDQTLSVLPLSHLLEQTCNLLAPLWAGASVVYLETIKPSQIMEAFSTENVTIFITVPRLLAGFKARIKEKFSSPLAKILFSYLINWGQKLTLNQRKKIFFFIHRKFGRSFRFFVSGGANLDYDTENFYRQLGFTVIQGYGLTECSPILTANREDKSKIGSVGLPLDNVELKISKDQEILARGPNITSGYYLDRAKTKAAFDSEGWFLTGDTGERDDDNFYYIRGRKKDVIVTSAGIKVYPDDLESVLNNLEGVKESCVIGLPRKDSEETHAVLILNDKSVKAENIISLANKQLDSSQQIAGYTLWPENELPKTTTLKIKKNEVREAINKPASDQKPIKSSNKVLEIIASVACRPLGSQNDRLYRDLKIDSIGRVELVSRLEQEFNIDFSEELITENTTVQDLDRMINDKKTLAKKNYPAYWPFTRLMKIIRAYAMDYIGLPFIKVWCRVNTVGRENLTDISGPVIFSPNHSSHFDQGSLLIALPEKMRYRTAAAVYTEFFDPPGRSWFLRLFRRFLFYPAAIFYSTFRLPKTTDVKNTFSFIGRLADQGENITIYPEGERATTDNLLPLKSGIAVLARWLELPIIPVNIRGTRQILPRNKFWPKRGQVTVAFGRPILAGLKSDNEIIDLLKKRLDGLTKLT